MPHRSKYICITLSALSLLSLSACNNPFIMGQAGLVAYKQMFENDVNVKQTSFSAADFMATKMQSFVGYDSIIVAQPLRAPDEDYGHKDSVAALSYVIPYQVGLRFSQLGYSVDLREVADNPQAGIEQSTFEDARFVLKGEFFPQRRLIHHEVAVNLNVVDRTTHKIVASFEYKIPAKNKKNAYPSKNVGGSERQNANKGAEHQTVAPKEPEFWSWLPF